MLEKQGCDFCDNQLPGKGFDKKKPFIKRVIDSLIMDTGDSGKTEINRATGFADQGMKRSRPEDRLNYNKSARAGEIPCVRLKS